MNHKRKDYISWDEYFMGVAVLVGNAFQGSEYTGGSLYCRKRQHVFFPWDITDFPNGCSAMMIFRGHREGEALRDTNILLYNA